MANKLNVTRMDIVREAREWIGTPFKHQMREKGVGCDCIGLILGIAWSFGFTDYDSHDYKPGSVNAEEMIRQAERLGNPISKPEMKVGDIVLIKSDMILTHAGILTDYREDMFGIIHAMMSMKAVKEHRLSQEWRLNIVRVYQFPGILD